MNYTSMLKAIVRNLLIVSAIFGGMVAILFLLHDDYQIEWIPLMGTILSGTFVLSINNPYNYIACLLGVLSSVILGYAFWETNLNSACTYLLIYLPSQTYSFILWKKKALAAQSSDKGSDAPRWQTDKERWISVVATVLLMIANVVVFYFIHPTLSAIAFFFDALFFATSIMANLLIAFKLTDSRIHWVIFSVAGIGVSVCHNEMNLYLFMLSMFFVVVNSIALVEWIKATPKRV